MATTANENTALAAQAPGQTAVAIAAGETSSSAIAAREKAAVEARYLVAMHRPRVFDDCRSRLLNACKRPGFARVARYAKPVGKEKVVGFSIRFAEEARVLWGNIDVASLLVFDDEERRIYRVTGTDLETNATEALDVMIEKTVERKVVKKGMVVVSQRLNSYNEVVYTVRATEDDMVTKVNAFVSKYRRNVILSLIPGDVKEECEQQILATIQDADAKDPDAARKTIVDAFFTLGVMGSQLAELIGKPLEQINPAELNFLRSYYTALKEGEATWSEIVEAHGKPATAAASGTAAPARGTAGLRSKLKQDAPADASSGAESDVDRDKRLADDAALAAKDAAR